MYLNADYLKSVKEAGIYTYEKRLCQEIDSPVKETLRENLYENHYGQKRKARPPMYLYTSEISLPDSEREIILQIFRTCVEPPTEYYRVYMANYYLTFERYYSAVLFLIPAANAPFNEDSIVSRIAHDENVKRDLDEISEILKRRHFYFSLSSKLKKLHNDILRSETGSKIHMYSEALSQSNEDIVRKSVTCEYIEVKNIIHKIPFTHTLDVVFGQYTSGKNVLEGRYGTDCPHIEKYLMQKEKTGDTKANKTMILSPVAEVVYYLGYLLLTVYSFATVVNCINKSMIVIALWWIILFFHSTSMLLHLPEIESQSDRFVFNKSILFHSERKKMHNDGIWSYCNLTEYGTFRKSGMKYIYFSKKHMTDEEFRVFKKKIIPYDYDSVAVPYKKDYMKIAENLIFAERKDR